ncbi:SAM-dependent methyltransferase [hydrothermal vent metagenome]|uniref:SAM-dependent methyltransferase n=1 Tax=hydrothermal vent metagenome TaxID=652676 RepID=A0A1W1BII3_9ZZZZ
MAFEDALHTLTLSDDGSYTAYSKEYDEHYHSTKDGALKESLQKHIIPAFEVIKKDEVNILDICYGLGFNTLATILYYRDNRPNTKLNIYSPELDASLVNSLEDFSYPEEFAALREIIVALSQEGVYQDDSLSIELFLGDAREYVKKFENFFDIVYQDAFSPSTNPMLWTKEYFADIAKAMKKDGVLTTYSIALKIRLALYENGFYIYLNKGEGYRDATIASQLELSNAITVDMQHKIACNPTIRSLRD